MNASSPGFLCCLLPLAAVPAWAQKPSETKLPEGEHTVRLKVKNPSEDASVWLNHAIIYGSRPVRPAY